jgi:hypothetical protein
MPQIPTLMSKKKVSEIRNTFNPGTEQLPKAELK